MECPTNPSQLRMECSKKWHGDFSCNTTGFFFFAKQTGYVTNNKQWSLMYLIYHIYCTATKQTIIIWYNYIIYIYIYCLFLTVSLISYDICICSGETLISIDLLVDFAIYSQCFGFALCNLCVIPNIKRWTRCGSPNPSNPIPDPQRIGIIATRFKKKEGKSHPSDSLRSLGLTHLIFTDSVNHVNHPVMEAAKMEGRKKATRSLKARLRQGILP